MSRCTVRGVAIGILNPQVFCLPEVNPGRLQLARLMPPIALGKPEVLTNANYLNGQDLF